MKTPGDALPWYVNDLGEVSTSREQEDDEGERVVAKCGLEANNRWPARRVLDNAKYIAHTAQAYPKIVEVLHLIAQGSGRLQARRALELLELLGEEP